MKRILAALTSTALLGGVAYPQVTINLRASVTPSCTVQAVDLIDEADTARIAITTLCNTENFQLAMASNAQAVAIQSAMSPQAAIRPAGAGELAVRLYTPGAQTFHVQLDQPLAPGQGVNIQIVPV